MIYITFTIHRGLYQIKEVFKIGVRWVNEVDGLSDESNM